MTISQKLFLPEIPQLQAKELMKLVKNSEEASHPPPPVQKTQLRSLDEIFLDIEKGTPEQVNPLEWVYCLYAKAQWDIQHPDRCRGTSQAIWNAVRQNSWLKQRLFWRLCLFYGGSDSQILAPSLAESFNHFTPNTEAENSVVKIVNAIKEGQPRQIAQLSWNKLLSPQELLESLQLPANIPITKLVLNSVAQYFANADDTLQVKQVTWLLLCFSEMTREQQVHQVEYLLINVSPEVGGSQPQLVNWLRQNYGSDVANSRWHELSSEAKAALRKWIGAVHYGDFQKLVDRLCYRLNLESWEQNQLEKRKGFWANYSDRFERIRILLPRSSEKVLGSDLNSQDVSFLSEDGSHPTEVCIFDLGDWFVVEFFRGPGSETRLFRRDLKVEAELFGSSHLTIKRLRCLGGEVHDHVYCWQSDCEKWLRRKNILPNEGTEYFKGLPRRYSQYNPNTGLPTPSHEQRQQRQRKLARWQQDIEDLEREAGK